MGLFGFIGKALGAVAHAIPGVGQVYDVATGIGSLLSHKQGMSGTTTGGKFAVLGRMPPSVSRGRAPSSPSYHGLRIQLPQRGNGTQSQVYVPRQVFSESPTMPGGGVATPGGIMPASGPVPPASFGGRGGGGGGHRRRKKRSSAGSSRKRKGRKGGGGRKLKFGSPAWRKKYMRRGR